MSNSKRFFERKSMKAAMKLRGTHTPQKIVCLGEFYCKVTTIKLSKYSKLIKTTKFDRLLDNSVPIEKGGMGVAMVYKLAI